MEKINILIVDDSPGNIVTLDALMQREDTNIISTTDPGEALRLSWEMDIAIAIIDLDRAEMDGFELAEILKSNPSTKGILIIFVTAISKETKYAVKGLNTGAVDYLYKPLDRFVTSAKVDSFIQYARNQREIKKKNRELEIYQEELIRTRDPAEQDKGIKEDFLANMSHEIRTPINGIIGIAQLLKKTVLTDEQRAMVNLLEISSNSLLGVIDDVLDPTKIESGKFQINRTPTDIAKVCEAVIDLLRIPSVEKNLKLGIDLDSDLPKLILAEIKINKKLMEEPLIPLNNIRILVAEDNPINKFLIIKILQNWQVEMDVVENGKEAIEKLRENDYDLILMDTFMPVMNGLEAIKLIREGYASGKENIPIITFSAAVMETDKETAIAAGANDVISKPFEPAALHKKILEYAIG